jgi:hypothetical protein
MSATLIMLLCAVACPVSMALMIAHRIGEISTAELENGITQAPGAGP